ncbi:MAG: DEAD/DEAH box helicase [Salinarimonas sp.]|nr:DEAD/DEAH box helicase [Salinarimonas sp.]
MVFDELGLSDKVLQAVTASGYTQPTPIQEQAIPHILARRDVLGIAQTGTGKTAAFTLPMLTMLETGRARARMPRTLILEPTRELAAQVQENFERYGVNQKLSVALLIGGVSFGDQDVKITRGVDVLIATPGRLLDHFERGKLLLTGVELLVIDEADRMLDMGFIPDIERIVKLTPFTRQTLFFSATMPPEIQRLSDAFLSNPVQIEVSKPASAATTITQRLVATRNEPATKRAALRDLIREADTIDNGIVFCNRKRDVATLHRSLQRHKFNVVALHGDMDQRSRMIALDSFRKGEATLLVASDVAARGLDIPAVSHVFNYDIPHHAEDYVHRIGRTGRAGRAGAAFTLVTPGDEKSLAAIEKLIGGAVVWHGDDLATLKSGGGSADTSGGRESGSGRARRGGKRKTEDAAPRSAPIAGSQEPSRGRSAGRSKAPEEAPVEAIESAAEQDTQPVAKEPVAKQRDERSSGRDKPRKSGRGRRDEEADALPVAGFGDHVPAFLLRPARPKSKK